MLLALLQLDIYILLLLASWAGNPCSGSSFVSRYRATLKYFLLAHIAVGSLMHSHQPALYDHCRTVEREVACLDGPSSTPAQEATGEEHSDAGAGQAEKQTLSDWRLTKALHDEQLFQVGAASWWWCTSSESNSRSGMLFIFKW